MVRLLNRGSGDGSETVTFSGRLTKVSRVWDALGQLSKLDIHDDHHLVISNTGQVMLYLSGNRSGNFYYIDNIVEFTEKPFSMWKSLMRALEVKYFEVVSSPVEYAFQSRLVAMGLEFVSKRVSFTVDDPSLVSFKTEHVVHGDNCSLEEIEALCALLKRTAPDNMHMLERASIGASEVILRIVDGEVVCAMFYSKLGNTLNSEAYICKHPSGTRGYGMEFVELFKTMLNMASDEGMKMAIGLAAGVGVPTYAGITNKVISHHYTLC